MPLTSMKSNKPRVGNANPGRKTTAAAGGGSKSCKHQQHGHGRSQESAAAQQTWPDTATEGMYTAYDAAQAARNGAFITPWPRDEKYVKPSAE
jgi:hypothetical protein